MARSVCRQTIQRQEPSAVSFADFNGDGNLDMVVTTEENRLISVLLGNGDGTFQAHVDYAVAGSPFDFPAVAADFNRDGKLDLVVPGFPDVSLLLGNGDGTFQSYSLISSDAVEAIQAGDFNEDGKLDLVMPTSSNTLALLIGNGDGTFQPEVDFPVGNTPFCAAVADLNLDGHLDVVVLNIGSF